MNGLMTGLFEQKQLMVSKLVVLVATYYLSRSLGAPEQQLHKLRSIAAQVPLKH